MQSDHGSEAAPVCRVVVWKGIRSRTFRGILSVLAAATVCEGWHCTSYFGKARNSRNAGPSKRKPLDVSSFHRMTSLPGSYRRSCRKHSCGGRSLLLSLVVVPKRALDVAPESRNRDAGLLNLNPEGRPQNKKYRPTVREPKALKAWLDKWGRQVTSSAPMAKPSNARYCLLVRRICPDRYRARTD
jgi:hypothetical protein